ncbi:uncharacterized protein RJT20DRAFT_128003 [Scheffersomyces xylosifermentans]|uniref:uncharacterized protein n=1 Tax=Scheffersomyces xylosifermentans TaxID=1304137 RepID=UPI00315D22AA
MLARVKESDNRAHSLSTHSSLADDKVYDTVDLTKIYEAVLKIVILEYCNEARFRTPLKVPSPSPTPSGSIGTSSSTSSTNSKFYRLSRNLDAKEIRMPSYLLQSLEKRLNRIAFKKEGKGLDEKTRRSFLAFYNELLKPNFKSELEKVNKPEYLVMKFVAVANKELVKLDDTPSHEISEIAFRQAETFVSQLIELLARDKDAEAIIEKLQETKSSLKPAKPASKSSSTSLANLSIQDTNVQYPKPSFRITDMGSTWIDLIQKIFSVDSVKIQQDVFRLKDLAQEKPLHKDIQQVMFYIGKDLGEFSAESFDSTSSYIAWKERQNTLCDQLTKKYQVPPAMKLLPIPPIPDGEDFYIFPRTKLVRPFFVTLVKLCLQQELNESPFDLSDPEKPLLSKPSTSLITTVARAWRIDYTTRASCIYTASHLSGALKDKLEQSAGKYEVKDVGPVDVEATVKMFHYCKKIIEDGGINWEDKYQWSLKDQDEWMKNLLFSYNETMLSIKNCLSLICSKTVRPKFGPYLAFLGDYIESDSLFGKIEETGIPKKWEKKLSKSLFNIAGQHYAVLVGIIPRDNTLNISHILTIADGIVDDVKSLQKRYKNPLLGFLNVPRVVAAVLTTMFAADAKHILDHINAYAKNKGEFVPFGDAIEAYKALSEIRDIHIQTASANSVFKFDLEEFFYPFLEAWVEESGEKILQIVQEAINKDTYEAIDIDDDHKKYSSSILDIFTLIKEFLRILKSLNWTNEYQLAKVYTTLLKSISDGALYYANCITDKIMKALDEEELKRLALLEEKPELKKAGGWLDEVKNVVSNIQSSTNKLDLEEPYNFKPETCIALNNLSAMMDQLARLEDVINPEDISNSVNSYEPNSQSKYISHVITLRLIKAENLKTTASSVPGVHSYLRPYVTLIDTEARKTIGKTRTINHTSNPEWDEEFEITLPPNTALTISATVWDERFGTHSICGRALMQLDPRRFKHDGIPQEIYLDLDSQGRVLIEIAVESERIDAIFVMGRAFRSLKRCQERCIKLIVEKFSRFIHYCFSRTNLKSICGNNGNIKPSEDQVHAAMSPLLTYLNMNLEVLAVYLTEELLLKVMLATWVVVVASADELLLPKLASAKTFSLSHASSSSSANGSGWQSAVSSAVANITSSIGISKPLTNNELETVFAWLNWLCIEHFHNNGNGPPIADLKNEHYQALLVLPVYYDSDVDYLFSEVDRLSPAFVTALRNRNNFDTEDRSEGSTPRRGGLSRAGSLIRNKTIMANATAKSRERAMKEAKEARSEILAQTSIEDIILRLLIVKGEKSYVAKRLDQRERLAHSLATQRLARAAAEGRFS